MVGDAEKAAALARNIPDTQVKTGHLIGVDLAPEVNAEIMEFLGRE